jgi:orotate phosphoribosyltransferase
MQGPTPWRHWSRWIVREVGPSGRSAVADLEQESGVRVIPLVTVRDVMAYLETDPARASTLADMRDYQSRYGVH